MDFQKNRLILQAEKYEDEYENRYQKKTRGQL